MQIVLGIQVEVDDMISKGCQVLLANGIATRVRRSHVSWKDTQDVPNGHFVVDHLIRPLSGRNSAEVLMSPSMRRNLVASLVHALNQRRPLRLGVVNLALTKVIASHEEGRMATTVALEEIDYLSVFRGFSGSIFSIDLFE
jgi:hypothetical protein